MKERLRRYARLLTEIEIEERRAEALTEGGYRHQKARVGIDDRLRRLRVEEAAEHASLMALIEALPCEKQRQVLFARYFDGFSWTAVTAILFGARADFDERAESYERQVYRLHGNALEALKRIEGEDGH